MITSARIAGIHGRLASEATDTGMAKGDIGMKRFEVGRVYMGYWFGGEYTVTARLGNVVAFDYEDRFGNSRYFGTFRIRDYVLDEDANELVEDLPLGDDDFMLAEAIG